MNNRRWSIVKGFQIPYVLLNLLYLCVGVAGWAVLVFGPLVAKLLSPTTPDRTRTELADAFLSLHATAWFGFALFVLLAAFSLIVQSNRVGEPLLTFSRIFDSLRRGDLSMRVRLRDRDYLHEEAAALDLAIRAVRRRIAVLKGRARRTDRGLETLRVAIAAGAREQVDLALENVVREAARTRTQLDSFTTESQRSPEPDVEMKAGGRTSDAGFTLVELLLTVAIGGTLMAIAIPAYGRALDAARIVRAIGDVGAIGRSLKVDELTTGVLPDSLEEAGLGDFRDPWGHPYVYLLIAGKSGKGGVRKDHKLNPINSDFDLYSMGKDGQTKTQLTNKDSLDDIVRANDGGFVGLAADF